MKKCVCVCVCEREKREHVKLTKINNQNTYAIQHGDNVLGVVEVADGLVAAAVHDGHGLSKSE